MDDPKVIWIELQKILESKKFRKQLMTQPLPGRYGNKLVRWVYKINKDEKEPTMFNGKDIYTEIQILWTTGKLKNAVLTNGLIVRIARDLIYSVRE